MTMKLYYHPLSTYSQKTLIAFHEKGQAFEPEIVELADAAGRAKYVAMYPLAKIPVLVHGDKFIPESSIIIEYIDNLNATGARLISDDREIGRKTRFFDRMCDNYLTNPTATLFFEPQKPAAEQRASAITSAKATLDITYKNFDGMLAKQSWLVGDTFSMADCAAAPALGYLRRLHPFTEYKNVTAYFNRLAERPSVRKVHEELAPYLAKM